MKMVASVSEFNDFKFTALDGNRRCTDGHLDFIGVRKFISVIAEDSQ